MKTKKFPDILSRFRDEVIQFSGVDTNKKVKKKRKKKKKGADLNELPRKQRRKLERKLKKTKRLEVLKKNKIQEKVKLHVEI